MSHLVPLLEFNRFDSYQALALSNYDREPWDRRNVTYNSLCLLLTEIDH